MAQTNDELITTALKRFDQAQDAYSRQRSEAREDLLFVAGKQWLDQANQDDFKLTMNLLGPFLRQITAEARAANPSIHVIPVSGTDVDLAEVYEGLIRHLEQKCDASAAYQTALWYAAAAGESYLLIDSEYCSSASFDQDLLIKAVDNPEKVFLDPMHQLLDGCDSAWAFVIEDLSHEAYCRQFPKSDLAHKLGTQGFNRLSLPGDWVAKDSVRVAKYWTKEYSFKTLYLVLDPVTNEEYATDEKPDDTKVVLKTRQAEECSIKARLINCTEVLEETDWPGTYIPVIKVTGERFYVGGQQVQYGAIRHAKDPQKVLNYTISRQIELIDLAPKSPFVGATGQFANSPEKWANANRVGYGFLDYTPVALNGQPVPPPTKVAGVDMATMNAIVQARQGAFEDLKNVFGLQDASLGRPGNEVSGIAIQNRMEASQKSTYAYFDHLLIALRCLGRQLVQLIPSFYDTERTVRIVKPDTQEELLAINSLENNYRYDLTKGTYDVVVEVGPAYVSKRAKGLEALQGLMQAMPQTGEVISDLVAGLVDSPVAQLAAKRLRATIPPEVLAATGENDQSEMAPKEQVQALQQQLAQQEQQLKTAQLENQELQVKVKIAEDSAALELTKHDGEMHLEMAKLKHQDAVAEIEARIKYKQLELAERELDLKEKQLQVHAATAAHKVLGDEPQRPNGRAPSMETDIPMETNIGGNVD